MDKRKARELTASWDKLKEEQSKPLLDKRKFGPSRGKKLIAGPASVLKANADRIYPKTITVVKPQRDTPRLMRNIAEGIHPDSSMAYVPKMSKEEYDRREAAAREVKHCVMPLHKGPYILVTDEEMIKQMGKKTA
jgi:hypothetical protein